MNINQLARSQQMMYNFISRDSTYASQMQTQLPGLNTLNSASGSSKVDANSLLQQMGVNGLNGRTVRELAKSQAAAVQERSRTAQQNALNSASIAQQFPLRTQYTPISDEATEAMQKLALQDAINSVEGGSSFDSKERVSLIQDQLKSVDPSKRTASFNTMNKVWQSELDRIGEYIKKKDASWNGWGDKFDTDILKDYKPGVNVWV